MRFKLTATVGNNSRGNTGPGYQSIDKCLYHCLYDSISDGDSFGPPIEMVNAGEEVKKNLMMMAAGQLGQHKLFGNELIVYNVVSSHVGTAHKSVSNGEHQN